MVGQSSWLAFPPLAAHDLVRCHLSRRNAYYRVLSLLARKTGFFPTETTLKCFGIAIRSPAMVCSSSHSPLFTTCHNALALLKRRMACLARWLKQQVLLATSDLGRVHFRDETRGCVLRDILSVASSQSGLIS